MTERTGKRKKQTAVMKLANCLWCSGEYWKARSTSLYCSPRCRVASNRRNYTKYECELLNEIDERDGVLIRNQDDTAVARIWKKNGRIVKVVEFD